MFFFLLGQGSFTQVHRGTWYSEHGEKRAVAVKHLRREVVMNSPYALQAFTQAIHEAAFWNHGTLVAIHALCLADPIQVIDESEMKNVYLLLGFFY